MTVEKKIIMFNQKQFKTGTKKLRFRTCKSKIYNYSTNNDKLERTFIRCMHCTGSGMLFTWTAVRLHILISTTKKI